MEHHDPQAKDDSTCQEDFPIDNETASISLLAIFCLFFQVGVLSFGGGLSAWFYREVVELRRWITPADFFSGLALGQVIPGINTTNLSIYIGQRLRGILGAVSALLGLLFAPFFIIIGLTAVFSSISSISWVHNFFCGVATSAVGIIISVPLRSVRHSMRGIVPFAIMALIIISVGILHWPILWVVLGITPVSVALSWRMKGDGSAR